MAKRRAWVPKAIIALYLLPVLFPFYWILKSALEAPENVYHPQLLLHSLTLTNFEALLTSTNFLASAWNSLRVALLSSVVVVICSALGGYGLARSKIPGKTQIAQVVLFSYMFPEVLLGIPFFVVFHRLGLLNSLWGLGVAHLTLSLPFALWLMWQFYQALPHSYEEAAEIDGASRLQTFMKVIVPLSIPALTAVFIFAFAASWNDFVLALMLIHNDTKFTLPIAMSLFVQEMQLNWAVIQAANFLLALPGLLLVLFGRKYLVRGFQTTGLAN